MISINEFDLKILRELQRDATLTADLLAERVALSRNACWRRMKRLEEEGYIRRKVALVDAEKAGLGLMAIIMVRTANHDQDWLARFHAAVSTMPEITAAFRMSGDLDYVLHARVADVKDYDRLYQRLIAKVPLTDVSASFVMEEIKQTVELPLDLMQMRRQARLMRAE
ncbi:MAG: Lrp/AsnC family transcriptional regulator [Nitratireductor sp.]|nr:Lrp/AsnC family transcriptional regulator [Nitratireductor sp.]